MTKIRVNSTVRILTYPEGHVNAFARVVGVTKNGDVMVTNLNQPFAGILCNFRFKSE